MMNSRLTTDFSVTYHISSAVRLSAGMAVECVHKVNKHIIHHFPDIDRDECKV